MCFASFSRAGVSPEVPLFVGGSSARHHRRAALRGIRHFFLPAFDNQRRLALLLPPTLGCNSYSTTTPTSMGAKEAKQDGGGGVKKNEQVPTETTTLESNTLEEANVDSLTTKLESLQVKEPEIPACLKTDCQLSFNPNKRHASSFYRVPVSVVRREFPTFEVPGRVSTTIFKNTTYPIPKPSLIWAFIEPIQLPFSISPRNCGQASSIHPR